MNTRDLIEASLRDAGLALFGLVGEAALKDACSSMKAEERLRYGVEGACGAVVAALAYGEGPSSAEPSPWAGYQGPTARLARFARANWYAELSARLKAAAGGIRAGLASEGKDVPPASAFRCLANSRLPERRLALEAGLGRLGRHGLVMLPFSGSAAVLGLLLLPSALAPLRAQASVSSLALDPDCRDCRSCVDSCPTGALRGDGTLDRELCLQHWSSIPGKLPSAIEASWGGILYGCDICQEACPRFRPDPAAATERGHLGPGLPARWLSAAPEGEIRAALRGTVLGMRWIAVDALRRNAGFVLH